MRAALLTLLALALALVGLSRVTPIIERVEVAGAARLTEEEVMQLANVAPGDPLLWVVRGSVAGLLDSPWIAAARVERIWPDTVRIVVAEREPVLVQGAGERAWSRDGRPLPGVPPEEAAGLPRVEGWGEARIDEAVRLAALLAARSPRVISYSPAGFDIELADGSLWTPSAAALESHWAAATSERGRRIAVYPWGVSRTHD